MIIVSNGRIRRKAFGFSSQIMVILVALCISYTSAKYFDYKRVIDEKVLEISNLNTINGYLRSEITFFDENLNKINNYFESINSYDHFNSIDFDKLEKAGSNISKFDKYISEVNSNPLPNSVILNEENQDAVLDIISSKSTLDTIHSNIRNRILGLEDIVEITGLRLRNDVRDVAVNTINTKEDIEPLYSFNISDMDFRRQGGPFTDAAVGGEKDNNLLETKILPSVGLNDDIAYLTGLEGLVHSMPVSRPIDNYYITSNFGTRIDPIRRIKSVHHGLDIAGSYHCEIVATAPGEVTFVGRWGAYGNVVEIDHGFGLKTRYGHLNKMLVSKGDIVNRGDIIGYQGNSGRSTGQHLHYEVNYKGIAYNPNKFLNAGSRVF